MGMTSSFCRGRQRNTYAEVGATGARSRRSEAPPLGVGGLSPVGRARRSRRRWGPTSLFNRLAERQDVVVKESDRVQQIFDAILLVEENLELPALLRHVVQEASSMTGARYGALGVLNDDQTGLAEFVTVGLEAEQVSNMGPPPTGKGVLGVLITDPRPLCLADIGDHPDAFGFPVNHPPMTTFLGVPIKVRGEVYGDLYLTDKIGCAEFTEDDVAVVETLALAAGVAIENGRLQKKVQLTAVNEDRSQLLVTYVPMTPEKRSSPPIDDCPGSPV